MEKREPGALSLVEAVDRVTRAVHIGARLPGARGRPLDQEDYAYLGGFVSALVESLALDEGFAELVVYAYLLHDGLEADAARLSQMLLRMPGGGELQLAFLRGRGDADAYLQSRPPVTL
ncbi:MAG: hypothetical protein KJ040_06030 [Gammaproteobacteria bacterium]|nr:hypothetical protein [Gammaproteobacteria bacterium]